MTSRRNSCELEIDLFCNGLRIDPSCRLEEDARMVARTRAGLGSGLELVLPGVGPRYDFAAIIRCNLNRGILRHRNR